MWIKFASDKLNEYSNGDLHFWNTDNLIEVTEIQSIDLLDEKIDGMPIFIKCSDEEIPKDSSLAEVPGSINNSGVVTTGSVPENGSDDDTVVNILKDSNENTADTEINNNTDASNESSVTAEEFDEKPKGRGKGK